MKRDSRDDRKVASGSRDLLAPRPTQEGVGVTPEQVGERPLVLRLRLRRLYDRLHGLHLQLLGRAGLDHGPDRREAKPDAPSLE